MKEHEIIIPGFDREKCSICGWIATEGYLKVLQQEKNYLQEQLLLLKKEDKSRKKSLMTKTTKNNEVIAEAKRERLKHT